MWHASTGIIPVPAILAAAALLPPGGRLAIAAAEAESGGEVGGPARAPATPALALAASVEHGAEEGGGRGCSLYLAPGSVPRSGLGVYTTRPIHGGESVHPLSNGPAVVLTDLDVDRGVETIRNYLWSGSHLAGFEGYGYEASVFSTGLGSIFNHHSSLRNIEPVHGMRDKYGYDDSLADRTSDPGAGAFSYYRRMDFVAMRDIEAGEEIFTHYGDHWFRERGFPGKEDYKKAQKLLEIIEETTEEFDEIVDDSVLSKMYDFVSEHNIKVATALPETAADYVALLESSRHTGVMDRSPEWIESHGLCLDNLEAGPSTILNAGGGAFAARRLSEGSVVGPIVLVQIVNRDGLLGHRMEWNAEEGVWEKDINAPLGEQMLVNYCFANGGNPSLLLCGTGGGSSLINHCSDRREWGGMCDRLGGPNAKIQWSSGWDPYTSAWLNMTIEELHEATLSTYRGLSFEVVATRNIEPGEEVFIDYGIEWEEAWGEHVKAWEPPARGSGFESAGSASELNRNEDPVRTLEQQQEEPYPSHIFTACRYDPSHTEYERTLEESEPHTMNIEHLALEEMLGLFGIDGSDYGGGDDWSYYYHPCDVYAYDEEDMSYTVHITHQADKPAEEEFEQDGPVFLINYPREAIRFFVKPGMSDQYLPNAFRFPIGVPDEIFPPQWKVPQEHDME